MYTDALFHTLCWLFLARRGQKQPTKRRKVPCCRRLKLRFVYVLLSFACKSKHAMNSPAQHRILYVQLAPDLYGASRALLHLLAALDRTRYLPLVALPGPGPLVDQLRKLDIDPIITPHIRVLMGQVARSWRALPFGLSLIPAALGMQRVIQRSAADLVHSNTWTTLSGALGARLAGVPHVWHIREILPDFGGLKPALVRLSLRGAARLVCISDAVAAQFAGHAGAERVQVVYDGLALPSIYLSASERDAV